MLTGLMTWSEDFSTLGEREREGVRRLKLCNNFRALSRQRYPKLLVPLLLVCMTRTAGGFQGHRNPAGGSDINLSDMSSEGVAESSEGKEIRTMYNDERTL